MTKGEQLAFLANDVAVLETLFANRDGDMCTVPGDYMPDGNQFQISLAGVEEVTSELRNQMVELVRSQYDAREELQNNPPSSAEVVPESSSQQRDTAAEQYGGAGVATEAPVPEHEVNMEAALESQITRLRHRRDALTAELLDAEHLVRQMERQVEDVEIDLGLAEQLREKYICMRNSPTKSRRTSSTKKRSTVKKSRKAGSTRASTSRKKTPTKSSSRSKSLPKVDADG